MPQPNTDPWLTRLKPTAPRAKLTPGVVFLAVVFVAGSLSAGYTWLTQSQAKHQAAIEQQAKATQARLARQAEAQRAAAARQATRPQTPDHDTARDIEALCNTLQRVGASTCTLHGGLLSDPYLDITFAGTAADARTLCDAVAAHGRQTASPFPGRAWQIKIFSPQGDGTRPMAVCNL